MQLLTAMKKKLYLFTQASFLQFIVHSVINSQRISLSAEDNEKPLSSELNPSKPFPSAKKTVSADIPLHLSAKSALYKLVLLLLENGGKYSIFSK